MSRLIASLFLIASIATVAWLADDSTALAQGRGGRGGFDRFRMRGMFGPSGGQAPSAQEGDKKEDGEKKEGEDDKEKKAKEEEKKPARPEPVKRPTRPMRPADPSELDVGPDDEGLVSFSFKGQPWPNVLEWLADISDMSLQWEEAPAGYLDLTTRGRYTVEEVRDLINSVLLSKGFTLLRNGDVLIVANLDRLDSSLVPRVSVKELDKRGSYELVKVFFDLEWLVAENAAEEIKPMLSPYGKVTALKTTNRLDVMETASNLRRIRDLLEEEQSDRGQQRLVREFRLRYTRAEEVLTTLQTLLGIEPKKDSEPLDPRQAMAMMMAQQAQGGQQAGPGGAMKREKEAQVFLAVNARENSILVNAPPDKMAIIEQAINVVDVSQNREMSLLTNLPRMQVYRMSGVAPETLVSLLTDLGGLDPTTRLEIDPKNRAIIAYAPLADHFLIRSLVEKLDGSGRRFEVLQLRMLSAEYVAGSIQTLMNGPEKTEQSSRSRYRYSFFGSDSSQEESSDQFQVEADIEHNRLLLRANDVELAEVKSLLVKLGEIAPEGRNGHTTRVIPSASVEDTENLLRRLERVWPSVAPNPLEFDNRGEGGERPKMQNRRRPRGAAPPADQPEASRRSDERTQRQSQTRDDRRPAPADAARESVYRFAQNSRVKPAEEQQENEQQEDEQQLDDALPANEPADADEGAADADKAAGDEGQEPKEEAPAEEQDEAKPEAASDEPQDAEESPETAPSEDAEKPAESADEPEAAPVDDEAEMKDESDARTDDAETDDERQMKDEGPPEPGVPDGEEPARRRPAAEDEPPAAEDEPDMSLLQPDRELPPAAHAPIKITVGPFGLMISSSDTEALDRLEDVLVDITPARISHKIFHLKNSYAKDVCYLLEDVFKEEETTTTRSDPYDYYWYGYRSSQPAEKPRSTLGKRKPLKFIPDSVTNTILVQGADASQLTEIEELIDLYDQNETPDSRSVRRTEFVALRYAKAPEVCDTVKDVYRDLLSPNDKALQKGMQPPQQQQGGREGNYFSSMSSYLTADSDKAQTVPRFKGMLSIGIDERSNSLAISAPQILLSDVLEMVDRLDLAARPTRPVVRVLKLNQPGAVEQIQKAFAAAKNEPAAATAAEPAPETQPQNGRGRGAGMGRNGGGQPGQN